MPIARFFLPQCRGASNDSVGRRRPTKDVLVESAVESRRPGLDGWQQLGTWLALISVSLVGGSSCWHHASDFVLKTDSETNNKYLDTEESLLEVPFGFFIGCYYRICCSSSGASDYLYLHDEDKNKCGWLAFDLAENNLTTFGL